MKMTFSEFANFYTITLEIAVEKMCLHTICWPIFLIQLPIRYAAGYATKILQWKKIDRSAGKTSAAVYRADLFFGLSGTKVQWCNGCKYRSWSGGYGVISRPDELFDDMADLFNQILRGSTHRNKNNEELEQYFRYLQEKYYRIKTLLYFSEPRPIYDFYIPNDLYEHGNYRRKKRIQTELMLLSFRKKFVVITGTGGLGKTMLMHHLVLTLG